MADPLPPWRTLLEERLKQREADPTSRHLQLATVRSDGRPANRTVVFRGFAPSGHDLCVTTDLRNRKVDDLRSIPWGELCWYFPPLREQFRILGLVTIIGPDEADEPELASRRQIWQALSAESRRTFLWPMPAVLRSPPAAFQVRDPDPNDPVPTFGLLRIRPHEVDWLDLKAEPWQRTNWQLRPDESWFVRSLNP